MKRVLMDGNGLKISQPGVDVTTANQFQLLFSSELKSPKLITKGTITIPSSFTGAGGWAGKAESTYDVNYGVTYARPPFVVAVGNAARFVLWQNTKNQYGYLWNKWITPVYETSKASITANGDYGTTYPIDRGGNASTPNPVDWYWASIKFLIRMYTNKVQFVASQIPDGMTVKYAAFDVS